MTKTHRIVGHAEWISARQDLLAKEKELTRARDALSQLRRDLPWERVEKPYTFAGPDGRVTLPELFAGRSQLAVYHFMFGPDWEAGCKSCSFWADNFNGIVAHLNQRDVTFVAISRAALPKLRAFAARLGWTFPWYSSAGSDFNLDYEVSFTPEQRASGTLIHNYAKSDTEMSGSTGISVFCKHAQGAVFHTYSCYARGLDMVNTAYHYLDLVPKGRDEDGLSHTMSWAEFHDQYGK